jgi:hypothetical protein
MEIYQEPHLFKDVRDLMIEFMKDGLTDEEKELLKKTDKMLGTLSKEENKELKNKRKAILARLDLLFNEVGRQAFTDEKWTKGNPVKKAIENAEANLTEAGKLIKLTKL